MLRDCDSSNVWETSFIAVNLHPHHRISFEDWLDKISPHVKAAEKYETEVINLSELLPKSWLQVPLAQRQQWLKIIKDDGESWNVDLLMRLRAAGMNLNLLKNIFKFYKAEQRIAATFATPEVTSVATTPRTPSKQKLTVRQKGRMLYHLWKVEGDDMTNLEKLDHAIAVRNRHLGPKKATEISPYLDVQISPVNQQMLQLNPDDLNMYKVLRDSNVKHGERHKVAKRALTMLGNASGMSGQLNGPKQLKEVRACLEFADSLEQIKHAEKTRKKKLADKKKKDKEDAKRRRAEKEEARRNKLQAVYQALLTKLGLSSVDQVLRSHVDKLTCLQIKAVALCQCGVPRMTGKLEALQTSVKKLLPTVSASLPDEVYPDHPAQDVEDVGDSSDTTQSEHVAVEDLRVGECVEVYWEGEHSWFEGEVKDISVEDGEFEIYYPGDGETLWHKTEWYPVRYCE